MVRHHIVQDKYLTQWRKSEAENQLNIYVIPDSEIIERGPQWKGFWREDFNILDQNGEVSYVPEDITAIIDTKGIETINRVDRLIRAKLSGPERSNLAFYIALQYMRTPRRRDETDKMITATTKHFVRKDISSPDKVRMSKEQILKHKPKNENEREILGKVQAMSDEEIRTQIFEAFHSDEFKARLSRSGHSKRILKVDKEAKGLFDSAWLFLVAPKGKYFVTSDSPCFTISPVKFMNGLLSPKSSVIFPLKPDICIYIRPGVQSVEEEFLDIGEDELDEINSLVVSHSYNCIVGKEKPQLESLIRRYDFKNHKKSRDVVVYEIGDYVMFNLE